MSADIEFSRNRASKSELVAHLLQCDAGFVPPLSGRVDIGDYAHKIKENAERFEAWAQGVLVGLVAAYCNDSARTSAFVTSVSVLDAWQGQDIASQLLGQCISHTEALGFKRIELEVDRENVSAIKLYRKRGFEIARQDGRTTIMVMGDGESAVMNEQRDYNSEIVDSAARKYAYGFDFEVMHPYMIKSFGPFFKGGSLLELGSYKGDFTRRFLQYFEDVTCVEVSEVAIEEAKRKLGDKVQFVHARLEQAVLSGRYDNIVLSHVLEHLDDPVLVLKRINDEWLSEDGRLFLVCPNANAPSRQIAVKMGLVAHNAAVTPAEAEHGHRRTYSLDTLERDARAAGLQIVHRSGIFFKALANFQWDRLLQTDIVSADYLEGCYQLGKDYPDLCASVFLLCERGRA